MTLTKKLSFMLIYALIPLPLVGLWLGGAGTFLPFLILFAGIPVFDSLIRDASNPSAQEEKELVKQRYFRYITYLYVPLQLSIMLVSVYIIATHNLSWLEWIGFAASTGLITGGVGINLSHEMMHKNSKLQHVFSKILLSSVCYGHFFIEHVKGHHVRVATPEDPATAQFGESLYHFLPKTVTGSFRSAWHLEQRRLKSKNYSAYGIHNQFWWIILAPMAYAAVAYLIAGAAGVAFFLVQSMVAILVLEMVNYIEHYGLERKKLANGLYERVTPYHSWNANHWLSNMLLFHLQRHSDHHTYGGRPYQILRHMDQSPQLPSGYLGMMVLCLFPPLWRAVMDKRVLAYREQLRQQELAQLSEPQPHADEVCPV